MVWLVVRAGIYVAVLAAIAWGVGVLLDTPGGIEIAWGGRSWALRPIEFVALFLGAAFLLWLALKAVQFLLAVVSFLSGDETAITRFFGRSRLRRGLDSLSGAMVALAEGDAKRAMDKTERAGRLLDRPELANLVGAQAARQAGADEKAERYLKALARNPRTQAVGLKGLLEQAAAQGDVERARRIAERAFALRPRDAEIMGRLFDLQTGSGDWAAARRTLSAEVRAGALPREIGARRDAVLALAESRAAAEAGDKGRAREAALEAHRLSPGLTPAAVAAAKALAEESGGLAKAERALKRTWRQAPHPDIAAAFAGLKPDESPDQRRERFQGLIAENRDHVESRLLEAELALAAEDFPAALKALGDLAESRPTTRSLAIMAAAERGSGSPDHVVRGWLAKALSAPRGERWVCEACGSVQDEWGPVCDECRAVDSLVWKQPEGAGESKAAETALLPVILGSLAAEEGRRRRPDAEDAETAGP